VPEDPKQLLFSTKGKDNWNPLFSQLISAQEGRDVSASSLAMSFRTLTMDTKRTMPSTDNSGEEETKV
jgi:hypothetical protein